MAIFDDVVVNAKTAAKAVTKKAGEIYDLSKIRISLATLRSELNKQYQMLGEAFYNNEPQEELDTIKESISDLKQNIADFEKVLDDARNTVTCPKCGEKLRKDAQFCIICGSAIPGEEKPTCASCGEELVKGAQFCYKCGTPVEDNSTEENTEE